MRERSSGQVCVSAHTGLGGSNVAFFSMLLGERVMTAVELSRLKKIQQKEIDDIGPLPHGDVTGVGNEAESRACYGTVEFLTYRRGKHRILLAPENQRRVLNLADAFCKSIFPQR
jgi:hypothetical protein